MRVLSVTSELFPLVKTGGLADVSGALPTALAGHGVEMLSLVPGYPTVLAALGGAAVMDSYSDLFGGEARLLRGRAGRLDVVALDAPHLFDRPGSPYLGPDGKDWPDNARRFAALSKAGADLAAGRTPGYRADVLHCHDWQAGLGPVYSAYQGGARSVMTIHNMAFQGQFPAEVFPMLDLPDWAFSLGGVEYYGGVGYLKGGLALADRITTVSPTYAQDICTHDGGMGLGGLLYDRRDVVHGIINGIDESAWDPAEDPHLPRTYTAVTVADRAANKRAVERRFGLDDGDGPLHGVVSRLAWQKGMDILVDSIDHLVSTGGRLAVTGAGEPHLEEALREAVARHPGRVGAVIDYDEALSHLIQGGCDTIVVPSRFEPCGLTQLYGLRYGCVPIVARTGGLNDTVIDANEAALAAGVATGFHFQPGDTRALNYALSRAAACYSDRKSWTVLQRNAMAQDVSWDRSAAVYAQIYRDLVRA